MLLPIHALSLKNLGGPVMLQYVIPPRQKEVVIMNTTSGKTILKVSIKDHGIQKDLST